MNSASNSFSRGLSPFQHGRFVVPHKSCGYILHLPQDLQRAAGHRRCRPTSGAEWSPAQGLFQYAQRLRVEAKGLLPAAGNAAETERGRRTGRVSVVGATSVLLRISISHIYPQLKD